MTAELLELKTYRQPSGIIIQLRRLKDGYERASGLELIEWGTSDSDIIPKARMARWQSFEENIGSELL